MTSFEDTLWRQLVDQHDADHIQFSIREGPKRVRAFAWTAGAAGMAAVTAALVLALSGTTNTPPAYALTPHADGTMTLTVYRLMTNGISALNKRLAHMGIDETVVPVTPQCTHQSPFAFDPPVVSPDTTVTVSPGRKWLAPGYQGVLAAEQLPNGKIGLLIGAMQPADIPSCFATVAHETRYKIIPAK